MSRSSTDRTSATGIRHTSASSVRVGSRWRVPVRSRHIRLTVLSFSTVCTGIRMVRPARALRSACARTALRLRSACAQPALGLRSPCAQPAAGIR